MTSADTAKAMPPHERQTSNLFDFPAPPDQPPVLVLHLVQTPDSQYPSRRLSAVEASPPGSPSPTDTVNSKSPFDMSSGLSMSKFKRFSKSTTSLPMMAGYHGHSIADNIHLGEYPLPLYGGNPYCSKLGLPPPPLLKLRAVKSQYNLKSTEECGLLSDSIFSMVSKAEPMADVTDLLTSIEYQSFESDIGNSSGTITLVSHTHGSSTGSNVSQDCHTRGPADPDTMPTFSGGRSVQVQLLTPVPRKQKSMAQLEAQSKNRNSMFVSGALLPPVAMSSNDELSQQFSWYQKDPVDVQLDKRVRRASRYLYDVPSGSSGGGVHNTLSKAFQWPQRIGRSSFKSSDRPNNTVVDHHKIYDIYEESIWHTTSTSHVGSALGNAAPTDTASIGKGEGRLNGLGTFASTHLRSLRSVASSSGLLPWRLMKSGKPQTGKAPRSKNVDWECSSLFSSSVYSDSDSSIALSAVHRDLRSDKKPTRKPSMIQMFVKKAGLGGLLSRSASFSKVNSRSATALRGTHDGFDAGPVMGPLGKSVRHKHSFRFATAMRQASNLLKGSLRVVEKKRAPIPEDKSDIVSAYPADSVHGRDLDMYLSRSAYQSPEIYTPINSATVCNEEDEGNDESEFEGSADDRRSSKYAPPKRPSYLGLHRKATAAEGKSEGKNGGASSDRKAKQQSYSGNGDDTIIQQQSSHPAPASASAGGAAARLRPTQFNSPFTTLPYGAYAQLNQLRGRADGPA
ncbi:hypothetical protein LPJ66_000896 [Kickxella alabastrina]|uniref:Uncharacterized protein n=1 Tax=Kickxella alabastrina TaxID=61397 RepID=A0ACC1IUQ0_9FUNG|nr:hypothetical protein LPJ66_000896 [Kickxella alabastrina]